MVSTRSGLNTPMALLTFQGVLLSQAHLPRLQVLPKASSTSKSMANEPSGLMLARPLLWSLICRSKTPNPLIYLVFASVVKTDCLKPTCNVASSCTLTFAPIPLVWHAWTPSRTSFPVFARRESRLSGCMYLSHIYPFQRKTTDFFLLFFFPFVQSPIT
jgi:hypothetical protein